MIITDEQKQTIKKIMPDIDDWLKKGYRDFIDEFYELILTTFKNDEPIDISYELERVYDEIVYQNKKK
ncbi:MAG: hypothetical protein NC037_00370 [Bacteroides sp.]|nr:hypothetical protein [Bacillota bacterium]MCM1393625.1 hypothetical protein [[Eubacterium] siraeum]MCM1454971.1 hypothetical protein [Bacteroides sp.]